MKATALLVAALLLSACTATAPRPRTAIPHGVAPDPQAQATSPALGAPPPETQPAPRISGNVTAPASPADVYVSPLHKAPPSAQNPVAEADLDGDGQPEQIHISDTGLFRISRGTGPDLFTYPLVAKSSDVKVQVHSVANRLPLVGVAWPWCPYGYDATQFFWYDRQKAAYATNWTSGELWRCGTYNYLGNGRFEALFRNNEFYYHRVEKWQGDHFALESANAELIRIEIDRLPDVLSELVDTDISDPEMLFASTQLYQQFKAKAKPAWRFANPTFPTPGSVVLQVTANGKDQGKLTVTYKIEAKYKQNILITGFQWP